MLNADHSQGADTAENKTGPEDVGGIAGRRLASFLERIERLLEEKQGLADDVKDVFAEAKGVGFDGKTIRRILKARKMDPQKRQEEDELFELYMAALGGS